MGFSAKINKILANIDKTHGFVFSINGHFLEFCSVIFQIEPFLAQYTPPHLRMYVKLLLLPPATAGLFLIFIGCFVDFWACFTLKL